MGYSPLTVELFDVFERFQYVIKASPHCLIIHPNVLSHSISVIFSNCSVVYGLNVASNLVNFGGKYNLEFLCFCLKYVNI